MRIEVDHTREDWQAFCRFYLGRIKGYQRYFWLWIAVSAGVTFALLWLFDRFAGMDFDLFSLLLGVALVYFFIFLFSRTKRATQAVPETWLGAHVYELRPDALYTESRAGTARFRWAAIREVCEEPAHLYLLLDNVTTIVLPKRAMEPCGGAETVKARIEELRRQAAGTDESAAVNEMGISSRAAPDPAMPTSQPSIEAAQVSSPDARSWQAPGWSALPRNLLAGLRLSLFLPVKAQQFRPSARQCALLILLTFATWLGIERLLAGSAVELAWYVVAQMGWLTGIAVLSLVLLTPRTHSAETATRMLTSVASAAPPVVLLTLLALAPAIRYPWHYLRELALVGFAFAVAYRAQRIAISEVKGIALLRAVACMGTVYLVFATTVWQIPQPWYPAEGEEAGRVMEDWYAAERTIFAQPDLVDAAIERLSAGSAGSTDVYFVGFAGFGEQGVFAREIRFANRAFARRLDLAGRSLQLINFTAEPQDGTPLATASGLNRALSGLARKMDAAEDVLLLFLTSHGSADAELSVSNGVLPLDQLDGATLRKALDDSGIRWRVIVISACHAGSFIPHLADERTMIVTAAHAGNSSFGCDDERELTWFGEAYLRDALPVSSDLLDAFERAKKAVTARELEEGRTPSEPQLFVGEQMKAKLGEIRLRAASETDATLSTAAR